MAVVAGEEEGSESESSGGESEAGSGRGGDFLGEDEAAEGADTAVQPQEAGAVEDDDDDEAVLVKRRAIEAEIDDDFEAQFMAVMQEAAGSRGAPGTMFPGMPPAMAASAPPQARGGGGQVGAGVEGSPVAFRVMMKRSGREDKSREVQVPASAAIAMSAKAKEEAEAEERNQIKRLVLEANKRDEEEVRAAERAARQTSQSYSYGGRRRGGGGGDSGGGGEYKGSLPDFPSL